MNSILSVRKDEPSSIEQRRNSRSLRDSFLFFGKYAELLLYILSQSMHECNRLCTYTRPVNISLPTCGLVLGSYTVEVVITGCFPTQLKPYYFPWLIPHFSINSFRLFPSYFSLRSSQFIPLARFCSLASFTSCRSVQKRRQKSHSIYLEREINQEKIFTKK